MILYAMPATWLLHSMHALPASILHPSVMCCDGVRSMTPGFISLVLRAVLYGIHDIKVQNSGWNLLMWVHDGEPGLVAADYKAGPWLQHPR